MRRRSTVEILFGGHGADSVSGTSGFGFAETRRVLLPESSEWSCLREGNSKWRDIWRKRECDSSLVKESSNFLMLARTLTLPNPLNHMHHIILSSWDDNLTIESRFLQYEHI